MRFGLLVGVVLTAAVLRLTNRRTDDRWVEFHVSVIVSGSPLDPERGAGLGGAPAGPEYHPPT